MRLPLSTLALLCLGTLHCGPADLEAPAFAGSWSMNGTHSTTLSLPGGENRQTVPASGSLEIDEGATSGVVFLFPGCPMRAAVSGNVASIDRGMACTFTDQGVLATLTLQSGTATRTDDLLQFSATGTATYVYEGLTYPGTWNWQLTMTRLSKARH